LEITLFVTLYLPELTLYPRPAIHIVSCPSYIETQMRIEEGPDHNTYGNALIL